MAGQLALEGMGSLVSPTGWELYGNVEVHGRVMPAYITSEPDWVSRDVWMWRRAAGQQVKFQTRAGEQVGPIHDNVAHAVIWVAAAAWFNPMDLVHSLACTAEVRANSRVTGTDQDHPAWRPIADDGGTAEAPSPPAPAAGDRGDIPAPVPSVVSLVDGGGA